MKLHGKQEGRLGVSKKVMCTSGPRYLPRVLYLICKSSASVEIMHCTNAWRALASWVNITVQEKGRNRLPKISPSEMLTPLSSLCNIQVKFCCVAQEMIIQKDWIADYIRRGLELRAFQKGKYWQ